MAMPSGCITWCWLSLIKSVVRNSNSIITTNFKEDQQCSENKFDTPFTPSDPCEDKNHKTSTHIDNTIKIKLSMSCANRLLA